MVDGDEHERTIAFADIALSQIRALRQSAEPRNYAIWYHYATGYNPALNKTINDVIAQRGKLDASDLHEIHDAYISSARMTDRLDNVGAKASEEIEQVMGMIDAALGTASTYSESLADATQRLGVTKDRDGLRAVIENLVKVTKDVERNNHALEARLKVSRQEICELQENLEAVRTESLTDPLTSLANRKYFDQMLGRAMAEAAGQGGSLSLIMIDIDHFKSFNDTYGHLTGDQVLRLVAHCVKQMVKGQDLAARYGGEEFAVILPRTDLDAANIVADHIRRAVMAKELMKTSTRETLGRVTISLGISTWHEGESAQALIERADTCLYAAKRSGRNRAVTEAELDAAVRPQQRVA